MMQELHQHAGCLQVRLDAGQGKGKGVFTDKVSFASASLHMASKSSRHTCSLKCMQDIEEDQIVLEERPLVAGQHSTNKQIALVCSHCFQFLGSLEMQLAWCKLAAMCDGRFVS